jgi:hypothetical protein
LYIIPYALKAKILHALDRAPFLMIKACHQPVEPIACDDKKAARHIHCWFEKRDTTHTPDVKIFDEVDRLDGCTLLAMT